MKVSCLCKALALLVVGVLSGAACHAAEKQIERPDFTLDVRLDSQASQYLKAHLESVRMSVSLADVVGPGEVSLAYLQHETRDSFSIRVRDLPFDPKQVRRLRVTDYEVLVNVASGRRKLEHNVLDCDLLQAPISQLQGRVHKIQCRLGDWVPR